MKAAFASSFKVAVGPGLALLLGLASFFALAVGANGASSGTRAALAGTLPNGVAAGDVTQTAAILWTRGATAGNVLFEYSTVPATTGVLTATATVTDLMQPVKVALTGLSPGTRYVYTATDAGGASAAGRFRTAAQAGIRSGLRFGVSGDSGGHLAPHPAIANADERDLDFFIQLGDTIYADVPSAAVPLTQATSLEEFSLKHNEIYSAHLGLNTWADLRASTSILAMIDDHEVTNDFAGGADASTDSRFAETSGFINEAQLYRNGLQTFQAYMPVRDEYYGNTGDPRTANKRKLYRFNTYGGDAALFLLDTRSFRDEPLPEPASLLELPAFLANSLNDTSRTFLGAQQLADLKADLLQARASGVTWKFIVLSGPIQNFGVAGAADRYEGYAAERTDLLRFIRENGIDNVVFIAASLHGTIVNNLTYQETYPGTQISTGAFEVIAGPVAIYPPFGPAVATLAEALGLITPTEKADYDSRSRAGKDEFIRQLLDDEVLAPLGYDTTGLQGSKIDATLLQGGYVSVHAYGWTEFEIGQSSQVLTVTTYGIDIYSENDLANNPGDIITRTPAIVSQFSVTPKPKTIYLPLAVKS